MHVPVPENEADLILLPFRLRPPRHDRYEARRAAHFLEALLARPALKGFETPDDEAAILDLALEFQRADRPGLHVALMLALAMTGNAIGCLTIAGMLVQRANLVGIKNRNGLLRRAHCWLSSVKKQSFVDTFRLPPEMFSLMRKVGEQASANAMTDMREPLERNESRVTVIREPLQTWKSDSSSSARYTRLNKAIDLKGDLNRQKTAVILDQLRAEYPWAPDLLNDLDAAFQLSLASGTPWLSLPPLLLVGPPGVGKTRVARRISELCGVPMRVVAAGGSSDNRDFAGTARGWGSAHPARVVDIFRDTETANPIVLIDEIDKSGGGDRNGRIVETLLTMLEPETRSRFYDEALATKVDLFYVNWILTANDLRGLGGPLLSRVRLVRMPQPSAEGADSLIDAIRSELGRRYGLGDAVLPDIDPRVRVALVGAVAKGASPRALTAMMEQVFAIELKRRRAS
jgi:hypothetical protein